MARERDYKAEYARRKARGAARGLSPAESSGKPKRDYRAEYRARVAREVAAGKRKPPRARPRNNQAPTGVPLAGARRWDGEDAAISAEPLIRRLRSDRRVFVYVRVTINGDSTDLQLWPNGGIRAGTLVQMIDDAGSFEQLLLDQMGAGDAMRSGEDPTINPQNRKGKSPRFRDDEATELEVEFETVVIQWT